LGAALGLVCPSSCLAVALRLLHPYSSLVATLNFVVPILIGYCA